MPSLISFTNRDMLMSKVVTPGWYRVKIEKFEDELSKKGDSTNYPGEYTIIKNADDGSTEFAGVPLFAMFNSKAMGLAMGLLQAFGITPTTGERYDLSAFEGKEVETYVDNEVYNNVMRNRINHKYRPAA